MTLEFEYVGFVPRKLVENMLRNRLNCKYMIMIPPIPQSSLKDSLCEWVRMSQLILCKYIIFFKNSTFYEGPLWKFHNGVRRRQLITPIISLIYLLEKKFNLLAVTCNSLKAMTSFPWTSPWPGFHSQICLNLK